MINFAFLDSGTGGLPYLKYLLAKKENVSCVYVGDTKNFPYGEKSEAEIIAKSSECVKKIIEKWNPNAIVIACNTISVTVLETLRKNFKDVPFVGTVPAIKPAALITKTKKIGLLATNATVNHPYTQDLISKFASDCTVVSRGDPELISFIEHEYSDKSHKERVNACLPAVEFFKSKGCDVIVLACTHFLNMADEIQEACGGGITVIDSRDGVVRHALEVELNQEHFSNPEQENCTELFVTGFNDSNDIERYKDFCSQNKLKFGGIL